MIARTGMPAALLGLLLVALPGCALVEAIMRGGPSVEFDPTAVPVSEAPHDVVALGVGSEALVTRLHLIRHAQQTIELQTFIWTDDETGRLVLNELLAAAQRGVAVRLLVDQMFSNLDATLTAAIASASPQLELKHYNPVSDRISPGLRALEGYALHFRRVNQRMHNKLMIVDGVWALAGGRNLENTYFEYATGLNYKDREVLIRGPIVKAMSTSFEAYWVHPLAVPSAGLIDVADALQAGGLPTLGSVDNPAVAALRAITEEQVASSGFLEQLVWTRGHRVHRVAFLADDPGKNGGGALHGSGKVTEMLVNLVEGARQRVLIQSPYLVLSDRAEALFGHLREERPDVQVQISTNSLATTDNWPAYSTYYRQKRVLLDDLDFRLHEFKPRPADLDAIWPTYGEVEGRAKTNLGPGRFLPPYLCLHAKTIVIDDKLAGIGSYNLDPRSANLNTEIAVFVWDEVFAAEIAWDIERDMAPGNSWVVARMKRPLGLAQIEVLLEGLSDLGSALVGIDIWPSTSTSAFELREGMDPVPTDHPDFYERYRSVGNFPGLKLGDEKRILVRMFKVIGRFSQPLM